MNHQYKFVLVNIQKLSTKGKTKPVFTSYTSDDMRLMYAVITLASFFPNFCNFKIYIVSVTIGQKYDMKKYFVITYYQLVKVIRFIPDYL